MSKIFQVSYNATLLHIWLFLLRIGVSGFMLTHGIPKVTKFLEGGEIKFGDPLGVGVITSLTLAVFAEVVCSLLLIVGFATRLACIPLITTMAIAAFVVHADDPFGTKEKALLFLLIYITLLVTGGGNFSVDKLLSKKSGRKR